MKCMISWRRRKRTRRRMLLYANKYFPLFRVYSSFVCVIIQYFERLRITLITVRLKIHSTALGSMDWALSREWKAFSQRTATNERWTTKLLPGLMTGPFVRCYRFPPDVTRRWVVWPDFLINSVLVVWTRTRSVCISFIRRTYPFCNRQTEFLFRSLTLL